MSNQSIITFNSINPLYFNNSMSKTWDITGTKVNNGDSVSYYYHTPITEIPDLKETGIAIFPNPSTGKFTLSKANIPGYIEIYNSTGNRIYSDPEFNAQNTLEIDLSGYTRGIYFVNIYNLKKSYTKKVIIQ